jgi:hypothetical protein
LYYQFILSRHPRSAASRGRADFAVAAFRQNESGDAAPMVNLSFFVRYHAGRTPGRRPSSMSVRRSHTLNWWLAASPRPFVAENMAPWMIGVKRSACSFLDSTIRKLRERNPKFLEREGLAQFD